MANLSVFDHFGPFWAHLDPFAPIQTKINLLPHKDKVGFGRGASEQNINSNVKNRSKFHEKNGRFLPLSCHEWQGMGPKEVFYSYLVPEMIS